jgi:two-component system, OmpR family, sensor histidine kinase BaeS
MDRMIRSLHSTGWRIWFRTVLPTGLVFLGGAVLLRLVVRHRLDQVLPGAARVFDQVFTGRYILWGAVFAMVVSSCFTAIFTDQGLEPYREVIRLTKDMANGNYGVRARLNRLHSADYEEMAGNVNALAVSLERTERLRVELVSNLAHEIRTPLTNLQGYLEALRDGVIEANPEALASVHEEVMRLVRLVDALHQLARADAMRRQNIERVPTDLDHMTEQLVRVMRPNAEARGIRVFMDLTSLREPVPVHADSIAQVMRNLLRNAVQYADEGGVIRVQSSCIHGIYRFAVLNTGPGIDEGDLPFIFNRFFRSDRARQGVKIGVGIGLAIARELVQAHGGRVGAQSKAGWTMVWFEVPTDSATKLAEEERGLQV